MQRTLSADPLGKRRIKMEQVGMCGRCYAENIEVFPAKCSEKPELLAGQPIGMYHCPDCGAVLLAGLPHPDLCKTCLLIGELK